jgi:hypothetical protein
VLKDGRNGVSSGIKKEAICYLCKDNDSVMKEIIKLEWYWRIGHIRAEYGKARVECCTL